MTNTSGTKFPSDAARQSLTANFHFIKNCNFRCRYCYATFADLGPARPVLADEDLFELTRILARRYTKVTFVGGEPTLYRRLPELLALATAEGALTNVVTNGSRINAAWLEANVGNLDFLTLSVDSDDAATHGALGRATGGRRTLTGDHYRELAEAARAVGIGMKVNTVVTTVNMTEDMSGLVRSLAPQRWKILQAAPVEGQNDPFIEELTPPPADFDAYVKRHQEALAGAGIRIVAEPVEVIRGSYIMVDPQGRFFDSTSGTHRYSQPILEIGIEAAFAQVAFDDTKFLKRGGNADYAWHSGLGTVTAA